MKFLMVEYLIIFLVSIISFYFLNLLCIKKQILIDRINQTDHKSLINKRKVPITGGFLILLAILFLFKGISIFNSIFFISIFFLGLLSDINKLNSPKVRFVIQLVIVTFYIYFNDTYVNEIRINYVDNYFFNFFIIKIAFTVFCVLILINGSNFIDGVNSLSSGYFFIILLNVIYVNLNNEFILNIYNLNLIVIILLIFLIFNLASKSFLGDGGSYLLSFYVAFFFIDLFNQNSLISPYYIVVLLWYPAFENFFSLFRRLFLERKKVKNADNSHLHHFLFMFLKKKIKNSKYLNSFTGVLINSFNLLIVIISNNFIYETKPLILILFFAIILYLSLYYFLKKVIY